MLVPFFFRQEFEHFKVLGLLGIFLINFLGSETIFAPSLAFFAVGFGGRVYNPILVAVLAASGSALGEVVSFVVGVSSRRVISIDNIKKRYKIFSHFNKPTFRKYAGGILLATSFFPNPLFDGIAILAGIVSYPLTKFYAYVFIGRFVRYLIIAWVGHNL